MRWIISRVLVLQNKFIFVASVGHIVHYPTLAADVILIVLRVRQSVLMRGVEHAATTKVSELSESLSRTVRA